MTVECVKTELISYPNVLTHEFHVVDERVAVLPGFGAVAGERLGPDVLGVVEVVERLRKEVHGVVDEGRLGLGHEKKTI